MKRRILYALGDGGRDEWIFKISKELQSKVDHVSFFSCGIASYNSFAKNKINRNNILILNPENQTKIKNPNFEFLKDAENKFDFNVWDLWEITAQRKKSRREIDPKKILIRTEYYIKELISFLNKNKITDYILYGPASFSGILMMKIIEQKKINIIELQSSCIKERFGIVNNLKSNWRELKINYDASKKNLSKKEITEAINLLQEYYKGEQKPDCSVVYKENKIKKIKRYIKAVGRMIRTRHFPPSIRPFFWGIIQRYYHLRNIFEDPVPGEKFVLFPLHFQPEISISFYGKWYNNQLNLIENVVRSLPLDCKLYVKEHSYGYGNRSLNFYKEIKKYPQIRLIKPQTNNLELIKKSSLVITITGTSGWEAIVFQKPTIVFGDVFYDIFECTKKIENIRKLPKIMRDLVDKKIDYEETLRCLSAMIQSTYPGLARLPSDCCNQSLEPENIKLLAKGIKDYLQKT